MRYAAYIRTPGQAARIVTTDKLVCTLYTDPDDSLCRACEAGL
jgi:hypothetical protein